MGNGTFELSYGTPAGIKNTNRYNGEEIKYKSFAAKDTAKERYCIYCKLD
jgi:hypothetical protein